MTALRTVLVLGGGLAGLAAATRLTSHPHIEVHVIEAGDRGAGDHVNALHAVSEIEDMWRIPGADPTLWRPWTSNTPPHYTGATGLRRQLGGRSLYWHGVVLRMDPWALEDGVAWPALGMRRDADELYGAVEDDLARWAGHPLSAPRSTTEENLLSWTQALGYPHAERTPLAVQRFTTDKGPRWRAYSSLYELLSGESDTTARARRLKITTGQEALEVRLDNGRPTAHLRDRHTGAVYSLTADAVVLAAGTVENTRLVAQLQVERGDGGPAFDRLNDHLVQGFAVLVPRSPWGQHGGEGACLVIRGNQSDRSNLFIKLQDGPEPSGVILNIWEMGEQEPSEHNRIRFPRQGQAPWHPVVDIGLSTADDKVLTGQQTRLQDIWDRVARALDLPTTRLSFGDYLAAPTDVTGHLDKAAARPGIPAEFTSTLGSVDHEAGTLSFGRHLSVRGEVNGAPGVFVAGPAVFPRSGAANPSLTSLALARHLADGIAGSLN